jgi:signal transduction histidine kinase
MHTGSTIQLRHTITEKEIGAGTRKLRITLCGPNDDSAKIEDEWCASQTQLRHMANQLLTIQENERKRIARDLHDGLGQSLNLIKFALAEAEKHLAVGAISEASESLQRVKRKVHGVLDEARHISMDLRPPMLDDLGILATISWLFRELEATCPCIKVEKDITVQESHVPEQLKITIFRIIQEATSNIIKYADADLIRLSFRKEGGLLQLVVEDNGVGFDLASVAIRDGSDRGLGLLSMKERASLTSGDYKIDSVVGKGTRICVSWIVGEVSVIPG